MLSTQLLPSGNHYPFPYLNLRPLRFAELLEYGNATQGVDPVERFYADYCLVKAMDPNIDKILLPDLDFAMFYLCTISATENQTFYSSVKCPKCGKDIPISVSLADVKFNRLDPELLNGLDVELKGNKYAVRIPTVGQFMKVFTNYRRFKRITDLRLIKIISLFEAAEVNPQGIEMLVANATTEDIKLLVALENILLTPLEEYHLQCDHCRETHDPTEYELAEKAKAKGCSPDELTYEDIEEIKAAYGGTETTLAGVVSAVFLNVIRFNAIDPSKIQVRKPRGLS